MSQQPDRPSQPPSWRLLVLLPLALLLGAGILWLRSAIGVSAPPPPTLAPSPAVTLTTPPTASAAPTVPAPVASPTAAPSLAPTPAAPTATAPPVTATAPPGGAGFSPAATLASLQDARVPARDLYALTQQIKVKSTGPLTHTTGTPPPTYRLGDSVVFNVGNTESGSYYTVTAVLRDVTAHAYWWVATDDDVDLAALRQSADRFESKIYPGDVATFGDAPAAGPDGDPRINVLNTPLDAAAGYFSAADMYTTAVNPYSNARKMIYSGLAPGTASYEGVLAHEFQHMIHWNVHPNQAIWLNEGMSELAMKTNGYDAGGVEAAFESDANVQLNYWSTPIDTTIPHYGAAYLFMDYLYGRYGADLIRGIMQAPGTDIDAIDQALAASGRSERFADVFADWALANWLNRTTTESRYRYPQLRVTVPQRTALSAPPATYTGTVHQQAADYLTLNGGTAGATVSFQGDTTVPLIAALAHSGQAIWWSNRGDVSAPSLAHAFDLSAVKQATLSFWTWYDIEDGFDYAYAEVSTDNGQTWDTLPGAATTSTNPNGNNLGQGYTGRSGGGDAPAWIHEQVDLSRYAGKPILLRFQYITDDGVNLQGFAVDDISIPEIGFADDAEAPGANGWTAAGFVHVTPLLPERFVVALISSPTGGAPVVTVMPLDGQNRGSLPLAGTSRPVLMVVPLAPATIQQGNYTVTVR